MRYIETATAGAGWVAWIADRSVSAVTPNPLTEGVFGMTKAEAVANLRKWYPGAVGMSVG